MTSKEAIFELARDNPAVHYAVSVYFAGQVSWEDAMMELVVVLARMNKEQYDLLVEMTQKSYRPSIFVKDWIDK